MYGGSEHTRKLMDRYKHQQHRMQSPAHPQSGVAAAAVNERCGDAVELTVRLEPQPAAPGTGSEISSKVLEMQHHTVGCSICQVSADFLCETAVGRTLDELTELAGRVRNWILTPAAGTSNEPSASPVPEFPELELFSEMRGKKSRTRCFLLPWEAVEAIPR
ncbi:MAG: iron-sulfur cluster assembly scaffold protein [Spirochaeta sp.]